MKKLPLIITLILVLFLAAGCGKQKEETETAVAEPVKVMPAAEGMILVNGRVNAEPGEKIFAERDQEDRLVFPLDAAMFYYANYGERLGGAGKQNLTFLRYGVNITETKAETWQKAGTAYRCLEGTVNLICMYDVHFDEEGVWFTPEDRFRELVMNAYTTYTITRDSTLCEMTLAPGRPMAYITVSSRSGNEEPGSETLRTEEMPDYAEYLLPAGTDRVEITAFGADGSVIEKKTLDRRDTDYAVLFDNGGQFLGVKTLHLDWTQGK